MLDASPDDSSLAEQPSTMPAGVTALGSLDKRRFTDELGDWNLLRAEPADDKVRAVERRNMLRCFVTPQLAEPEEAMDVFASSTTASASPRTARSAAARWTSHA